MKGCFVVYENEDEQFDIKCDLRPDIDVEVPELQSLLYSEIENTSNVLKTLEKTSDDIKRKYFKKLLNLAQVGLVPQNGAQPKMAMIALEKLKNEMLRIEGKRIKNQYMKRLGITTIILSILIGCIMYILSYLLKNMESRHPASVKLCALLNKPERREVDVKVDYVGFEVPNEFLVGYGLDYDSKYRNLPYIGILKPEVYTK